MSSTTTLGFEAWMTEIDRLLSVTIGMQSADLEDWLWHDAYDDGLSIVSAIAAFQDECVGKELVSIDAPVTAGAAFSVTFARCGAASHPAFTGWTLLSDDGEPRFRLDFPFDAPGLLRTFHAQDVWAKDKQKHANSWLGADALVVCHR